MKKKCLAEAEFCLSNIFSEHGPISYEELVSLFSPEELVASNLERLTEDEFKRYKTAKIAARRSVIAAAILAVVTLSILLTYVLHTRREDVFTKSTTIIDYGTMESSSTIIE